MWQNLGQQALQIDYFMTSVILICMHNDSPFTINNNSEKETLIKTLITNTHQHWIMML